MPQFESQNLSLGDIIFIDVETVPAQISEARADLFAKRFKKDIEKYDSDHNINLAPTTSVEAFKEIFAQKASLMAEFGQIICVSIATVKNHILYVKSIYSREEKDLLKAVSKDLIGYRWICGHNLKEFDGPMMFRRYLVHGMPIPPLLNSIGKKPWEVAQLDTLEIWGATQYRHLVSLELLCDVLNVPSPKGDMTGADVAPLFADGTDESLKKIAEYCQGDVIATVRVFCRMLGMPALHQIEQR